MAAALAKEDIKRIAPLLLVECLARDERVGQGRGRQREYVDESRAAARGRWPAKTVRSPSSGLCYS